jgi:hypothetical protein
MLTELALRRLSNWSCVMKPYKLAGLLIVAFGLSSSLGLPQSDPLQNSTAPAPALSDEVRVRSEIRAVEDLLPHSPDRGGALYFLARRYAQLGQLQKALALLKECISKNEGFDPGDAPAFEPLKADPEFRTLVELVRRRYPPVYQARVAFTIPETDLFPEGLAVDLDKHVFYMGSMHRRKIVQITQTGEVSDFVKPGLYDLMPIGGIKADPADHGLWAATDPGDKNRSELLHFDSLGRLLERFFAPGAGRHDLNDLVLRNSQEVYITDTDANHVYRFDRQSHHFSTLTFPRPLFYPNGITLSDDGNLLYVADILGVVQVDLRTNAAREVTPGKGNTLAGIDGLYWYKGSLVGVQYGTGSDRVVRWRLSRDGLQVTSTEILEYRSTLVSFPTTGAIVGQNFYFISNTGIGNLKDDKVVDPNKLEPVHVAVVPLK